MKGNLILERNMPSAAVPADVHDIDQILNDFTKRQRYNGKIIALQSQNRNADQKAEQGSHGCSDQDGKDKTNCLICYDVLHGAGEECAGESAHTHKARMSEAQFTEVADHEVQSHR